MNYKPVKFSDWISHGCVTVAKYSACSFCFTCTCSMDEDLTAGVETLWLLSTRAAGINYKLKHLVAALINVEKHHCAERPVLSSLSLDFLSLKVFSEWLCLLSLGACPRLSIHDFCQKHKTHHFFCAWIFLLLFFPLKWSTQPVCIYLSIRHRKCVSLYIIFSDLVLLTTGFLE